MTHQECDESSFPTLGRARFNLIVLIGSAIFLYIDQQIAALVIEPMKHDLGLTDVQVGLATGTATFAAYGLLAIPMGMLVDRWNRVRMLIVALLLWSGGTILIGLSHDLWLLSAAKALMGAANAVTYPAALSLLADSFAPNRRAFATAGYAIGQNLGQAIGMLVGGLGYSALVAVAATDPAALAHIAPWRVIIMLCGVGSAVIVIPLLAMREPARMEVGEQAKGTLPELWAYRSFLAPLFLGMMFLSGNLNAFAAWNAPVLMRLYKLSPGEFAPYVSGATLVFGLIGLVLSGKLVDLARRKSADRGMIFPAVIASALCIPCAFMAVSGDVHWFAILFSLYLVAGGAAIAVPVIAINFCVPNELRGLCMGLYIVLVAVAGMIAAPLVGLLSEAFGGEMMLGYGLAAFGVPSAALATLSYWVASRKPVDKTNNYESESIVLSD